jgi:ribosomal protein L11 methylase PrmA
MCLAAIDRLHGGPAIDVGCGSGLLTQAWLAAGKGSVVALDADPAAVAQTKESLAAAGLRTGWRAIVARIESLSPADLHTSTVLANLPPAAHAALVDRLTVAPHAIVISGTSRADGRPIVDHCRELGMRLTHVARTGRYVCSTLVGR